ncbi:MAG: flippase-like domain-containing protein, partial [Methanoregula sp.]|nr:flippase-like domain-containing protein [Methanoregula sp.]
KIPPINALEVFSLTGLALGLEFIRLWIVVQAFGFDMNIIHLSIFFSLAVLIGLLSQIPIGIGVVEGSLAVFLTDAGLPGYYAMGIVLVDRIISMYFVMVIGLIYYKWALKAAMEESG